MMKEKKLTIDKDLMKHSNIHPIYRTAVINWLIKLQVIAINKKKSMKNIYSKLIFPGKFRFRC